MCSTGPHLATCKALRCRTTQLFDGGGVDHASAKDWRIVKELPKITNLIGRSPDHVAVLHVQIAKLGQGMHMHMAIVT